MVWKFVNVWVWNGMEWNGMRESFEVFWEVFSFVELLSCGLLFIDWKEDFVLLSFAFLLSRKVLFGYGSMGYQIGREYRKKRKDLKTMAGKSNLAVNSLSIFMWRIY
jgi:hypothetical protein